MNMTTHSINNTSNEIAACPLGKIPPEAASNNQPNHMLTESRIAFGHLSLARLVNHAVRKIACVAANKFIPL